MESEKQFYSTVGDRIRTLRKSKNLSQQQLAEIIDLERTSLTNIEAGSQRITLYSLFRLSTALGTAVQDLLPEESEVQTHTVDTGTEGRTEIGSKTFSAISRRKQI